MNDQPIPLPDRIARARERRVVGDFRGAVEDLSVALENDPRSADALCERGLTRAAAASIGWRVSLSSMVLTGLFEEYDAPVIAIGMSRGRALLDAVADLTRALELEPARADAWLGRARLRRAMIHPDAWADYARAMELLPADAAVRIEVSGHQLNANRAETAQKLAADAVALAPGSADAWAAQGRARLARQDTKGALKDFDRALELDPGHVPSRVGRARSRAWDEPSGAREDYARAAAMTPSTPEGHYYRGLARHEKDEAEAARNDFTRALEGTPPWSPYRADLESRLGTITKVSPLRRIADAPVTSILLGLCIALFVWAEQWGRTTEIETLLRFGATERGHVWGGQYWRLFTSMFLHIGPMHLAWNVWAMFGWCERVERILGRWRFLAAYLLCGLASSALSLVGHHVVSAGASGAAFGMIGILLSGAYSRLGSWSGFLFHRAVVQINKWVLLWFILGMTVMPMDNWGHLGGLLAGLAIGSLWAPAVPRSAAVRKTAWAAFTLAFGALLVAACHPWPLLYPEMKGWSAFRDAAICLDRGNPAEAELQFNRSYDLGYRTEFLFYYRAQARQKQNKMKEALEDYDEAIRLKPDWAAGYQGRGLCREAMGEKAEALRDYSLGLEKVPNDPDLRAARAKLLLAQGDLDQAVKEYREALRHAPADWNQRASVEQWLKVNGR